MKNLLICIVLLSYAQYAAADASLTYKELISKTALTYEIKDQQIKLSLSGVKQHSIYRHKNQQLISIDPESGKQSMINPEIIAQRVSQLNQKRLQKLSKLETDLQNKLSTMKQAERDVGENLINLLKYPNLYGEHTLLQIKKSKTVKTINNINCRVYALLRGKMRLKSLCMASEKDMKLKPSDYKTLRGLYAFNYAMQSKIMIAAGNTKFTLVDYDKENIDGVLIESIEYKDKAITEHLILDKIAH